MGKLEHRSLFALIEQYGLLNALEGEWIFAAVEPGPEPELDVVTPMLRGEGQVWVRQTGLHEALCDQLACFMRNRLHHHEPLARAGVVRFAPYIVELVWLPDAAAGDAVLARRSPNAVLSRVRSALRATIAMPQRAAAGKALSQAVHAPLESVAAEGRRLGFELSRYEQTQSTALLWHHVSAFGYTLNVPLLALQLDEVEALAQALSELPVQHYKSVLIVLTVSKKANPSDHLRLLKAHWEELNQTLPVGLLCVWQPSKCCLIMHRVSWLSRQNVSHSLRSVVC